MTEIHTYCEFETRSRGDIKLATSYNERERRAVWLETDDHSKEWGTSVLLSPDEAVILRDALTEFITKDVEES